MPNIYVFWKSASNPPVPWTRLTRQGKYVRFASSFGSFLTEAGAATHNHGNSMSSFSCGNSTPTAPDYCTYDDCAAVHIHSNPTNWSIGAANNAPPYYGLDIIYMDLAAWEANERRFPAGAIILSSQALTTDATLTRFLSADDKFIKNTTPGETGGSTNTHSHSCVGTTGATTPSTRKGHASLYPCIDPPASHTHNVNLTSSSTYVPPKQLVTRLYEALALTLKSQVGTVVFCDGDPGSSWEVLAGWAGANLKAGNSDPTISGSDTHAQTISGNSTSVSLPGYDWGNTEGECTIVRNPHYHSINATLSSASHVPLSVLLVPIKLLVELQAPKSASSHAQLIGLTW